MSAIRDEYEQSLVSVVRELDDEQRREVKDFAEFLRARQVVRSKRVPTFEWQGALRDLRDKYTSVELQHEISDIRAGLK